MILETIGDITTLPANQIHIIAHQTNCRGVMGAGVAKQIKEKLLTPQAFNRYLEVCNQYRGSLLGETLMLPTIDGRLVANCFGEDVPTGQGLDTNYNALMHSLNRVRNYMRKTNTCAAIPGLIGCGLAGGDWKIVSDIIVKLFANTPQAVCICYYNQELYNQYHIVTNGQSYSLVRL